MYRRLIARDGGPLSEKELAEQDRKQEAQDREARAPPGRGGSGRRRARPPRREGRGAREERAVIDEVFRMDDIRITGREMVDGRDP